ncbi:MAG: hypothetical protein ACT4P3_16285 [Betaproteobacteria bacterium]
MCGARKSHLRGWYRSILERIRGDTPSQAICDTLSAHSRQQVTAWLEQLETLGFIALRDSVS